MFKGVMRVQLPNIDLVRWLGVHDEVDYTAVAFVV
jgi:hypothetical protein